MLSFCLAESVKVNEQLLSSTSEKVVFDILSFDMDISMSIV